MHVSDVSNSGVKYLRGVNVDGGYFTMVCNFSVI